METNDLLRRAEDLASRCERSNILCATGFLTPAEQMELRRWAQGRGVDMVFAGGGEDCERTCAFFLPDYLTPETLEVEDTIRSVAFESFFGEPGHRDYLGSVLGQGIRREWVGDIRISGSHAWIFCLKSVESTLSAMDRVGRYSVRAASCSLAEVPPEDVRREALTFTVQSLRLDAVAAGLFRLSRTAAAREIRLGTVSLNYTPCLRPDAEIREGDILSLRGKGKGTVTEIGGRSRKDRLFVTVEKRL